MLCVCMHSYVVYTSPIYVCVCVCVADIQEKLNCFILSGPRFIGLRVCKGK